VSIDAVIENLLAQTDASRVTLRQESTGETFPVTHEALASGVESIRNVTTPNMMAQPVVIAVTSGKQVIQDDCLAASDAPHFHEMLETYGGMRAQIVTPLVRDGQVRAILSLHQLGRVRDWTEDEVALCDTTAAEINKILERGA
jgi:GAF domain-containing protein